MYCKILDEYEKSVQLIRISGATTSVTSEYSFTNR